MAIALGAAACGDRGTSPDDAPIAVLSAFPAELEAVVRHATIDETFEIDGRTFRSGRIGRTRVILAMTGIGLANATLSTRALLEAFDVSGVVVSGVAGSTLRIGDVAVPVAWTLRDGPPYEAATPWLEIAAGVASELEGGLEACTEIPSRPEDDGVCLFHAPAVVVGGVGRSDDTANDIPFPCRPGGDDVFGCDLPDAAEATAAARRDEAGFSVPGLPVPATRGATTGPADDEEPRAVDMETAAIAREAVARGLPFIAFRAVSDGAGDPLGLPGFPTQFFTYYRLAARNAAAAAAAFVARLATRDPAA